MICENCLHFEMCHTLTNPERCCFYREKALYVKKEQCEEAVSFSKLLDKWYSQHEEWVEVWDDAILRNVSGHRWDQVISYSKMCGSIACLMDKYTETWESEFVISVFEKLSYSRKQDFILVMQSLLSAQNHFSVAGDYKRLVEVYKDFVFLIELGYIAEGKHDNLFRWLLCRLGTWSLKKRYERRHQNART